MFVCSTVKKFKPYVIVHSQQEGRIAPHIGPSSRMALRYVTGPSNITGQGWVLRVGQGQPQGPTGEMEQSHMCNMGVRDRQTH